jgi:choline dehydrogenase
MLAQPSLLSLALSLPLIQAAPAKRSNSTTIPGITGDASALAGRTFDYIICGGGMPLPSAKPQRDTCGSYTDPSCSYAIGLTGLTVASRLTEDPNISVAVIEAGEDKHLDPRVYDVRTYGEAFGTELDTNLTSTPVVWQNNTNLQLVAGHMLGGSDSLVSLTCSPRLPSLPC